MISTTNISMLNIEELMAEVIKVWRGPPDAYLEEEVHCYHQKQWIPHKVLNVHCNEHIYA